MPDLRSPMRKAWTVFLALLVILTCPAGAGAQGPATDGSGTTTIVTTVRVQTPSYQLDALGLRVPGYGTNSIPGAPALPVWSTVVELPATGEPIVAVEGGATRVLGQPRTLPAVPVPQPADPNPLGWSADVDRPAVATAADRPDPAIYKANAFYPAALAQAGAVQWQGGRRLLPLRVFPFQYNPVSDTLRYYPDLRVTVRVRSDPGQPAAEAASQLQPGISNPLVSLNPAAMPQAAGGALRIRTGGRGMYRLTGQELAAAGVPLADPYPATFAVSYLGEPVDIQIVDKLGDGFGLDDLVIFYAEPYAGRYQTDNVYWFTYGGTGSPRMGTGAVAPPYPPPIVREITEITQTLHVESNVDYRSAYSRPRDADHWFDTQLYPTSGNSTITRNYDLALDDVVTGTPRQAILRAAVHGGTNQTAAPDQSMRILLNGNDVGLYQLGGSGLYQWEGSTDTTVAATLPADWLGPSSNQASLVAALAQLPGLSYYWISPDYVELTYPALADADGTGRLYIESLAPGAYWVNVAGFTTPEVGVFDIRDPRHPVQLTGTDFDTGTDTLSFWNEDLPGPTYTLSLMTEAALLRPTAIEPDTPSDWGTPDHTAGYIAIVYRDPRPNPDPNLDLWGAIDPLLAHRADPLGDHFSVAKVDVQDIYDEFNYGRRDPEAIRSFLSYAYHNWNGTGPRPQYVLLVGSGTYDFTGAFIGATKPNLIPPYLVNVDPWIGEVPADNRYVSVDPPVGGVEDFLPDMHVGRIPAQSGAQVTAAVAKILAYEGTAAAGDWQRRAIYVADDCNNYAENFNALSDVVRLDWLPEPYEDRTVYYGSNSTVCPASDYYSVSGMMTAIKGEFNSGALMLQWFGHGSRFRWGDAGAMFSNKEVYATDMIANTVWPVTFSYTCWTGYFVNMHKLGSYNYDDKTLGEALILTDQRGSVADLSPSGQHVGGALLTLNEGITQAIFHDAIDRMGPAVDAGKLYYWSQTPPYPDIIDTSILFGDPATRLRLPPLISAARDTGNVMKISWKHVSQYTTYQVWRSTRPYFKPYDFDAEQIGTVPAPTSGTDVVFYDNQGAIGNADLNYFYVVRGVNAFHTTAVSNPVGEFDFALVPGG